MIYVFFSGLSLCMYIYTFTYIYYVTVYLHVWNIALRSRLLISIIDTAVDVFQTFRSRQHVTCWVRSVYLELVLRCSQLLGGFRHLDLSQLPRCHGCLHHPATRSVSEAHGNQHDVNFSCYLHIQIAWQLNPSSSLHDHAQLHPSAIEVLLGTDHAMTGQPA